jgi:prepilin-type N-terminal cleavage/methylation domain-containing protein
MRATRTGMSLFEVTIVMLLLAVLAAIATPRFSDSLQNSKLVAAANQIAGHIDYVRRTAMNDGKATTLHCNPTTARYWSNEVRLPHLPDQLLDVDVKSVHHPAFELTADFDGETSLSFDFEGVPHVGLTPLRSGRVTILSRGRSLDIWIAAGTGDTTIRNRDSQQDDSPDAWAETR